ncbi:GNAT family N-acetyltransferase [Streptomyces inhibens]|uniref:GNAT family N-acetyltransferase n=1 Tax=Streptomyces inhibens TaxID=2293571 RepID=UPI0037B11C0A
MKYIERPDLTTDEALTLVANSLTCARALPRDRWAFGIAVDDDLMGMVRLQCRTEKHASISYILHEDSWGRGYATQAVAVMLRFAFTTVDLESVGARHHPDNRDSGRVLTKNGFTYRGTRDGWPLYDIQRPRGWGWIMPTLWRPVCGTGREPPRTPV